MDVAADPRRLRVNIVFESEEPFAEESWIGETLQIGTTRLRVVEKVPRCRMIDVAQDGAEMAGRWLKALTQERDMNLAVYAEVLEAGRISVLDSIQPG
jgi:uncharacterized protein YcbX